MNDMKQFIASIENKTKKIVNSPVVQPKRFVKKIQPVRESEDNDQKIQAFVNVLGEVLYRHGLNEDKINEIISEIYGNKPVVENYTQTPYRSQYQPQEYAQAQYAQPHMPPQRYNNYNKPRNPIDEASRLLEGYNDTYSSNQYQGQNMPNPVLNSNIHSDVYRNLNAAESQGGMCYAPTLEQPYNPSGAIITLPIPKELQNYMPNQVPNIPTNLVPIDSGVSNTVNIDYGSNLL